MPLILLLLLQQIPAARSEETTATIFKTQNENNKFQSAETTIPAEAATTSKATKNFQTSTTTTTTTSAAATAALTLRELRKHEQLIDNSIDFTVDPCDDFYQYACGEWQHHLYDNDENDQFENNNNEDPSDKSEHLFVAQKNVNDDLAAKKLSDDNNNYDRTLAMIDYLADKEVLKYFHKKNMTKNLNIPAATTTTTTTTTTTKRRTTKEPDFIIKVHKYYKSCINIQQYEPIKYLEWLELNEHVKWPSLINTTTASASTETKTTTTTNSEEHNANKHNNDHDHVDGHHHHRHGNDHHYQQDLSDTVTSKPSKEDLLLRVADEDHLVEDHNDYVNDDFGQSDYDDSLADDHYSWIRTLAILRKYGLNGIFIEEIIYNTKTFPSKLLLGFDKPLKEGGFKSLKSEHLKIILKNLNLDFSSETFKNLWLQVSRFEWQLTKLNDLTDDLGSNMIALEDAPVNWLNFYLQTLFNQTRPLDTKMRLVITNVAYFMALDELLNEYDNHFLNQYLQIRFLWHLHQQEPSEFQPLSCLQHIKQFVPLAFQWIYEQQKPHLYQEIPKIQELYNSLRQQFNLTLFNNRNNFDSVSLNHLVSKLESIQLKIGLMNNINPLDFFYENRKFYHSLKLSSKEFFANHLKIMKFNFEALHHNLRTVSSSSIYYDMQEIHRGLTSSPYFNKRLNTLNIPLSLLQTPIYHPEFSEMYKFSSLGFILAQTLMYSFNLNLIPNELSKTSNNLKCLSFLDPSEINDKIADVSGLRLAYNSFFHLQQNTSGFLISNRKKFFLNLAQLFCSIKDSADDEVGRSHVNYALAQFTEFSKTFECSTDSHMNPHEKCYLWD